MDVSKPASRPKRSRATKRKIDTANLAPKPSNNTNQPITLVPLTALVPQVVRIAYPVTNYILFDNSSVVANPVVENLVINNVAVENLAIGNAPLDTPMPSNAIAMPMQFNAPMPSNAMISNVDSFPQHQMQVVPPSNISNVQFPMPNSPLYPCSTCTSHQIQEVESKEAMQKLEQENKSLLTRLRQQDLSIHSLRTQVNGLSSNRSHFLKTSDDQLKAKMAQQMIELKGELLKVKEDNKALSAKLSTTNKTIKALNDRLYDVQFTPPLDNAEKRRYMEKVAMADKRTSTVQNLLKQKRKELKAIKRKKKNFLITWTDHKTNPTKVRLRSTTSLTRGLTFHRLCSSRVPIDTLRRHSAQNRLRSLKSVIDILVGGQSPTPLLKAYLIGAYLKSDRETLDVLKTDKRLNFLVNKLTPEQTTDLMQKANLTYRQTRTVRQVLKENEKDIFASENKTRQIIKTRELETEMIREKIDLIRTCTKEGKMKGKKVETECWVHRRPSLIELIEETWQKTKSQVIDDDRFKNLIWMAIGGDKGGTTTKIIISFLNVDKPSSVSNLHILAVYEGDDSSENLRRVLKPYIGEWESIRRLQLPYPLSNGQEELRSISPFLYGDMMFQSNINGLRGHQAKYPCMHCLVPLNDLRKPQTKAFDKKYPKRSLKNYRVALKLGKFAYSVCEYPIFPLEPSQRAPSVLHLYLGIGTDLLDAVELEAQKLDLRITDSKGKNAIKEFKKLTTTVDELKINYEHSCQCVDLLETALKELASRKEGTSRCNALMCFSSDQTKNGITCDECRLWYHMECCLIFDKWEKEYLNREEVDWRCPPCQGISMEEEEVVEALTEALDEARSNRDQAKINWETVSSQKESYENVVLEKKGAAISIFEKSLTTLGIDRQAFLSNVYVGNHILKAIDGVGPEIITSCLEKAPEIRKKYKDLMTQLNSIRKLMNVARFLNDDEVESLIESCRRFGQTWIEYRKPDDTITPKMHMLVHHVPEFAARWRTVGLVAEHGIEALHGTMNRINTRYACMRDVGRRLSLMIKEHERRQPAMRKHLIQDR